MKKIVLLFVFFLSNTSWSQEDAWVYFNSKSDEKTFFEAPLSMLSQKALDRRKNQNILLDNKDIPINSTYIAKVKEQPNLEILAKSKWLNALHIRGSIEAIRALKTLPFVDKVDFANKSLNQIQNITKKIKHKKENLSTAGSVGFSYGKSDNQITMLKGNSLHQKNFTGLGITIAVLDGGFLGVNTSEPFKRLRDNNKIAGGYDFVNRTTDFYTGSSHGTYVLSSMGGYKENALVGTAPDAFAGLRLIDIHGDGRRDPRKDKKPITLLRGRFADHERVGIHLPRQLEGVLI